LIAPLAASTKDDGWDEECDDYQKYNKKAITHARLSDSPDKKVLLTDFFFA
jgi:hypothetical protein